MQYHADPRGPTRGDRHRHVTIILTNSNQAFLSGEKEENSKPPVRYLWQSLVLKTMAPAPTKREERIAIGM